jgi:hypothetical protein
MQAPRNSYRQMRLAGASSADQHSIALFGQKGAARQIADQRLVDRRAASGLVLDQPFYQPVDLAGFFHVRQVSGLLEDVNGNA